MFLSVVVKAWDLWRSNRAVELIDPVLLEDANSSKDLLLRYVNIALLCVQERAEDRPTMSDVVSMFTNEAAPSLPPKEPAFSNTSTRMSSRSMSCTSKLEECSINKITISVLEAR